MRVRFTAVLAALALLLGATSARAQSQTGEIFGKVTDESGAVLPGVVVTLTGPSLLQPLTATTSETGSYQFPRLTVGTYNLKFELAGFKTIVQEGIEVTVGFSANISPQLGVSAVQETVTVTSETPVVDTKQTGTRQTFTLEQLQSIPSARDPWVILQQTAGIAMDRENIGGNMSGQQSNYVSRGGNPTNNKWSLDGVDITDMSATGASPSLLRLRLVPGDDDHHRRRRRDAADRRRRHQPGDQERHRQVPRLVALLRHRRIGSRRTTSATSLRRQGATSGNPIQNIKDYGVEAGRPDLQRGRAWVWGSFGKQTVDVGVVGFYKPSAGLPGVQDDRGGARGVDRGRQRLPEHRPHAAADDQPQGGSAAVQGQPAVALQQLRQEGAQRARRVRPEPDRDHHAAEGASTRASASTCGTPGRTRPTSSATSGWSAIGCCSTCSTRTSATTSRSACSRRTCAPTQPTLRRLHRHERPLGGGERVHPPGQQPDVQLHLLPARLPRRRSLASRSAATGAIRTRRRSTTPAATPRCGSRPRPTNDCSLAATGCQVDLTRDGYSVYDSDQLRRLRAGHDHQRPRDAAARPALRLQQGQGRRRRASSPTRSAVRGCRRSTSPAPTPAWRSTTSRRVSASPMT